MMRIPKTKEAARTREKQKSAAAQTEIDPEYAPPSDEEDIVTPVASTSKSRTKSPGRQEFTFVNGAGC
jgi:hypothetical protein